LGRGIGVAQEISQFTYSVFESEIKKCSLGKDYICCKLVSTGTNNVPLLSKICGCEGSFVGGWWSSMRTD
jgi:hypothetical protein